MSESRRPRVSAKYQPSRTSSRATYLLAGVAIVVIAVVVIGGIIWNSQRDKGSADQAVLAQNASLIIGKADAPHTIDVFEDFQCPYCKQFEASSGQAMINAANAGKLRVRYHILNFLDRNSGSGDYSSRAAGAALCVAQAGGADQFLAFHTKLFEQQPAEGGDDPDNAALAATAGSVGASQQTQQCISSGARVDAAKADADQSLTQLSKALGGNAGTPTVLSEGKPVANVLNGPGWLTTLLADNSSS
ncbi:MAG: DsbA family protein [Williamsia herbipolensis]|uniref:Protein-disulfide isomerase n=1 Tax=Williamsia serinedens TaxID=391736 RepID=A0ABT1H638_9NOCA|nr:DsbA family protein [Williamsia serinedens]MBE7161099.1 DsbA family protein [Williamsia herbipolensis]MCP2161213.1 Protein-disulfide isomerase [Williamsia serinedens]